MDTTGRQAEQQRMIDEARRQPGVAEAMDVYLRSGAQMPVTRTVIRQGTSTNS